MREQFQLRLDAVLETTPITDIPETEIWFICFLTTTLRKLHVFIGSINTTETKH
jgi:hypothetical protein